MVSCWYRNSTFSSAWVLSTRRAICTWHWWYFHSAANGAISNPRPVYSTTRAQPLQRDLVDHLTACYGLANYLIHSARIRGLSISPSTTTVRTARTASNCYTRPNGLRVPFELKWHDCSSCHCSCSRFGSNCMKRVLQPRRYFLYHAQQTKELRLASPRNLQPSGPVQV